MNSSIGLLFSMFLLLSMDLDSILSSIRYRNYNFDIIDTAGLRKKNKISDGVELASAYYSRKEIRYSNCVILVIDALKGLSSHDITLSNYIIKEGRSFLLVFNKWDLIKNQYNEQKKIIEKIKEIFFDAKGINILFISKRKMRYYHGKNSTLIWL